MQSGECEPFLPKVLQRGTDVINLLVDEQETVVRLFVFSQLNGWIFFVVPFQIQQ